MKKLLFLVIVLSSSGLSLCMNHKVFLRKAKAELDISKMDWSELRINQQKLRQRETKVTEQRDSFLKCLVHFSEAGIQTFIIGSVFALSSYVIIQKNAQNGISFINQNFIDFFASASCGLCGAYYLSKGTKASYNLLFNWKSRKQNKLEITQKALIDVKSKIKELMHMIKTNYN